MNHLLARNIDRPDDDPIFALNREANARRARGDRVINATVGALLEDDGALATMPTVIEALREVPAARGAAYAPIAGDPAFLAAVIDDLLGGTPLAAQAVAIATPGGSGALRLAVGSFLERGEALLTTSFHWGPYATLCDENERTLRTFTMFDAQGGFDAAALERAATEIAAKQGRLLVFLNDPCHNPTGYSMTDAEWVAVSRVLARAAERVPVTLLCDVAYLAYARDARSFLAHLPPLTARGVLVLFAWSASKAFAQYGLRIGALIACTPDDAERNAIHRALSYSCRGTWSNVGAAGQAAIGRCITDPSMRPRVDAERARLRALLDARVDAFNAAAKAHGTLRYPRYDGGFFVTVFTADAKSAAAKLKERGVFVVPAAGALRVALCSVAERDVPELVASLESAVGG